MSKINQSLLADLMYAARIEGDSGSLTRFAESIVRECAKHIMDSSDRYRKEYFADRVLKHFHLAKEEHWVLKKVPGTKDTYFIESGNPPKYIRNIYGIKED